MAYGAMLSNVGDVLYWNTEDGALITKIISVTNSPITSISVSPNGSLLKVGEHDYTTGTNITVIVPELVKDGRAHRIDGGG